MIKVKIIYIYFFVINKNKVFKLSKNNIYKKYNLIINNKKNII